MKNTSTLLIILILSLGICKELGAQTLRSQAEVDAWDSTITNLTGNVTIDGVDITNLDALANIEGISGYLGIMNTSITNLSGLSNLTSIDGGLNIDGNIALENVDGLMSVTALTGALNINNNDVITNVDGLINITIIGGQLYIRSNPKLTSIDGLANITSIRRTSTLGIEDNDLLTNVDALSKLASIDEGRLLILENPLLQNINGLSGLTSLEGDINLIGNASLTNIDGFSNLTSIDGRLTIEDNEMLADVNGFSSLATITGTLTLRNNMSIANLDGFSALTSIINGGDLIIINTGITNIESLSNLNTLIGVLRISGNNSLLNIDALSVLTNFGGRIDIFDNGVLTNIDGFNALTSIEGNISISNNNALVNILGLGNVTSIPGSLVISRNEVLSNIDGLSSLTSIAGYLEINGNNSLANVDGLLSLTNIEGSAGIMNNASLADIDGLANISSVTGSLTIRANNSITEINALDNLTSLAGILNIEENESLLNLDGLTNLTSVNGRLNIEKNNSLVNLSGLENITSVNGWLLIRSNTGLENLDGLENLASITGTMYIQQNSSLTNIDGLVGLTSLTGTLDIQHNHALTNIDGFTNLTSVDGRLSLTFSNGLENIDGLSNVTEVDGSLSIGSNRSLTNIDGLSNLESINGSLDISNNIELANADGLSSLTTLVGVLTIGSNRSLTDLSGLANLESVDGRLNISSNRALTDIKALENLTSLGGRLSISNNSELSECCILTTLINSDQHGEISISNNATGCKSVDEVLNFICGLSVNYETNPPCFGASNGSIDLTVANFESLPISYSWEEVDGIANGSEESDEFIFSIDGLSAGNYNITITAAGDERILENVTLEVSAGSSMDIIEVTSENAALGQNNGTISITYSGGQAPYSISLTGPIHRDIENINDLEQTIANLLPGEYSLFLYDANGQTTSVDIKLIDEDFNSIVTNDCVKPMDIIILNLVSGAISAEEYKQSKDYFEDFYQNINLGLGADESRVALAEWSGKGEAEIRIDMTGDDFILSDYHNLERSFTGATDILAALQFGNEYLEANSRPSAQRVIIFTFDGCAAFSAAAYAEELKESGIIIADIGIGIVNGSSRYRQLLMEAATAPDMAYFGNDFLQLDPLELALSVAFSDCSASSSSVYFNRDGAITIDEYSAPGCPFPESVEITFTVSSLEQLSVPTGTPVSFYHNDPGNFGASLISTFIIPCSIPAGGSETFTASVPITTATHLYAILNDLGETNPAFDLPVTDIAENRYSNNIADEKICVDAVATIQALKSSVSLYPICEDIIQYNINVCNISEVDAFDVSIVDEVPSNFDLLESSVNVNGCSTQQTDTFDIPANCCVSLTLSYDVSNAPDGSYADQGVTLSGPAGQTYLDFDGSTTTDEDILLNGQEDCGDPTVSFTKEVDHGTICSDHSMTYTYYIDNKSSTPLYNLQFSDVLPVPIEWVYKPYFMEGLSIASSESVSGQTANFTIDQIDAETVASFQIDVYVGHTDIEVIASSRAALQGFPSYINGGERILESNEVTTTVLAEINIELIDTIILAPTETMVDLDALLPGSSEVVWSSTGDGKFSDPKIHNPRYVLGEEDMLDSLIGLFITVNTYCGEKGVSVLIMRECELAFERMRPVELCDDEMSAVTLTWLGGTGPYRIEELDTNVDMDTTYELTGVGVGLHNYTIEDAQGCRSQIELELNQVSSLEVEHTTTCLSADLYEIDISVENPDLDIDTDHNVNNMGEEKYLITNIPIMDSVKVMVIDNISGCEKEIVFGQPGCNNCQANIEVIDTHVLTCEHEIALLDASASSQGEAFSVVWLDENNDTMSTEYTYTAERAGEFIVELFDSNISCTVSETVIVMDSRELPTADILSSDALCNGDASGELRISNVMSSSSNHQIYLDDVLMTEETVSNLLGGEYLLAIEDADGCSFDTLLYINEPASITIESAQNNTVVNEGSDLLIQLITDLAPENIDSVIWDPKISCDNCLEYLVEDIAEDLSYLITIIDANGCKGELQLEVRKESRLDIFVPNAMSSDMDNSIFYINSSIDELMIEEMSIYDRWGERVFAKFDFPVNDPFYGWDGTRKGQSSQVGVYTYLIKTTHKDEKIKLVGDITLLK